MPDPVSSAKEAGLRYVSSDSPGILRRATGKGFAYFDAKGRRVRDAETLARIRSLAIPPAWTDVWICASPNGHIQAVGRDARGRKQYRYHPRWRAFRDQNKFHKVLELAHALPAIRAQVERDLAAPGLGRDKVLATVVRLLEETLIRVGNEAYARENHHFGLTTLRNQHAKVQGAVLHFRFVGKSGKARVVDVRDPQVARVVRRCQDLPGHHLFEYLDESGEPHAIGSSDVNEYLQRISGHDFTAKDFRTWAATVLASLALNEVCAFGTVREAKRNVVRAIERVAARLGNTPAVCRKCYVHPAIVEAYLDGDLVAHAAGEERGLVRRLRALRAEEVAVVKLLSRRLAH